ncbi:chemoreceptor glutamine deamidase CheD [Paludibacterium paludis]|uniref:Probable chemoreceptor glutamine deamidase CheD n=1 Tax=Paludibacterium paludis TaxID=1225769 RepID=A0A918P0Q9_9NEIS|nr:chemoreceptor glutamine deamidase CheD [Paludibacterium paludis]GGY10385.1 putative chemoreceptor glutamine deamidase CheD 1 [Paludibacterium paludis]
MAAAGQPGFGYFDAQFQLPAVKLLPGEYLATRAPQLLVTVLGSCVAACLRDRKTGISGMNHFMLPEGAPTGDQGPVTRFGMFAMERLINDMLKLGASREGLEAKVFGGGNVLHGMKIVNIGAQNGNFVLDYLANERIPVLAEDLLGEHARKVYFFTDTGKVMIRRLKSERLPTVAREEARYRDTVEHSGSGDVELFD